MSLNFFCDQCVPTEITDLLRCSGHQAVCLRDVMPIRSPDPMVIEKAQSLRAILISLNGDFSDIVAYPPCRYLGIVALQLHNHPEIIPALMKRLITYLQANPAAQFYEGKLLIVEVHRIRVRR